MIWTRKESQENFQKPVVPKASSEHDPQGEFLSFFSGNILSHVSLDLKASEKEKKNAGSRANLRSLWGHWSPHREPLPETKWRPGRLRQMTSSGCSPGELTRRTTTDNIFTLKSIWKSNLMLRTRDNYCYSVLERKTERLYSGRVLSFCFSKILQIQTLQTW